MDIKSLIVGQATGGGYPEPTGTKSITSNGTGIDVKDYASADVNVANSYSAGDEGKVVSSGALVSQTSVTKTSNGTYDTTLNNEVVVNVPQPSGNINITGTSQVDVSAYATAQVVDADLVAGNIKKDVNILGVTGSLESGITPSGTISITSNGTTDVTNYASASVNVPTSAPDNYIEYNWLQSGSSCVLQGASVHCSNSIKKPRFTFKGIGGGLLPQSVTLPSHIEEIPKEAFYGANGSDFLVSFPSALKRINEAAFYNCARLGVNGSITALPDSVTYIDQDAFYGCTNLGLTTLPSGLTTIGNQAFMDCLALNITTLPQTLTQLGSSAFRGCTNLAITSLPSNENFLILQAYVFLNCPNVTITHIPSNIKTINSYVFQGCTSMTSIIFDGTPTTIKNNAFMNSSLTDIYVPWSEGDVANAPWGATNATIHYDTV